MSCFVHSPKIFINIPLYIYSFCVWSPPLGSNIMPNAKHNWSVADTIHLFEVLKELMTGWKTRNSNFFKLVSEEMNEARIHWTTDQIKNRWRSLKAAYKRYKASQNGKVVLIQTDLWMIQWERDEWPTWLAVVWMWGLMVSESPGPIKRTSALLVSSLLTVNTTDTTSANVMFCIFYVVFWLMNVYVHLNQTTFFFLHTRKQLSWNL